MATSELMDTFAVIFSLKLHFWYLKTVLVWS